MRSEQTNHIQVSFILAVQNRRSLFPSGSEDDLAPQRQQFDCFSIRSAAAASRSMIERA
jgi:hypothetical protein